MDDELDKFLYDKLNSEKKLPEQTSNEFKKIAYNTIYGDSKKIKIRHYPVTKVGMVACAMILATTGIVYAGTVIANKIWKEPEKTVGFYSEEKQENTIITEAEKQSTMSEKEAREKTKEILEKFGHKNEKIKTIELENNSSNYELYWDIETDNGTSIRFDAKGGNNLKINCDNVLEEDIEKYRTTEAEAIKTAKELCGQYGYDVQKYNHTKVMSNLDSEEESYIWTVIFAKKYDELINEYESIHVTFIPEINEIKSFIVNDEKCEENPIETTKEEAKQTALAEEQKVSTKYKVKNTYVDLSIEKMNGSAYLRTTDYDQYIKQSYETYPAENYIEYRTENRIRTVWAVTIEYDIPEGENSEEYFEEYYTYFVDATTNEVIGGEDIWYLLKAEN